MADLAPALAALSHQGDAGSVESSILLFLFSIWSLPSLPTLHELGAACSMSEFTRRPAVTVCFAQFPLRVHLTGTLARKERFVFVLLTT